MMNTIVNEKLISFKELEIKIFDYICELGREMTQIMLERYDVELREGRNKKEYQHCNHGCVCPLLVFFLCFFSVIYVILYILIIIIF